MTTTRESLALDRQIVFLPMYAERPRDPAHFLVARRLRQLLARRQCLVGDAGAGTGNGFVDWALVRPGTDLCCVVRHGSPPALRYEASQRRAGSGGGW